MKLRWGVCLCINLKLCLGLQKLGKKGAWVVTMKVVMGGGREAGVMFRISVGLHTFGCTR